MQRYLMHVSYIGTQFRGAQKIINLKEPYKQDPTTIQGSLEIALSKLRPINPLHVVPSSRTDSGVHALNSTFHVDLLGHNGKMYDANYITIVTNKFFYKNNFDIRISKTLAVPQTFHCRYNAKSRTYLYRLAILKDEYLKDIVNIHAQHIPVEENKRCHFLCLPSFDIGKVHEISKLFSGRHDFRTFMGKASHQPNKITRRNLVLAIEKGASSAYLEVNYNFVPACGNKYNYWNLIFKSEGFLYNQVRRIVGTLLAVGQGKVARADVVCMLQVPSHLSWNPRVNPAPSHGLYLCEVEY